MKKSYNHCPYSDRQCKYCDDASQSLRFAKTDTECSEKCYELAKNNNGIDEEFPYPVEGDESRKEVKNKKGNGILKDFIESFVESFHSFTGDDDPYSDPYWILIKSFIYGIPLGAVSVFIALLLYYFVRYIIGFVYIFFHH